MTRKLSFAVIVVSMFIPVVAASQTITWSNSTSWTDNTPYTSSEQSSVVTRLYHGTTAANCQSAASPFATVSNNVMTWTGTLPVTDKGSTTYYCATNEVPSGGGEGAKGNAYAYTVPFVAPGRPDSIVIR